jgi:DNA-binding transcriptional regulator YhcF (GntR family)
MDALFHPVDRDSELPLGVQLARRLRAEVAAGRLGAGERLPSIRDLAQAAGVNVNTVRAVYQRLEDEGVLRSEQGRGTFVAAERGARRELQRQIARLEAELAHRPQLPADGPAPAAAPSGRLLTTEELRGVRDSLHARLAELDETRADLIRRLEEFEAYASEEAPETEPSPRARRSSTSLANVRLRWV